MSSQDIIAACGLNCSRCDIFRLPTDTDVQERLLPYFRSRGWLGENEGIETVIGKRMYCKGCRVDMDVFWSEGCKIAACCKGERGLSNCSECDNFGCQMLVEHAQEDEGYRKAHEYLESLRKAAKAVMPGKPADGGIPL